MFRVTHSVDRFARSLVFCSSVKESGEHLNAVAGMEEKGPVCTEMYRINMTSLGEPYSFQQQLLEVYISSKLLKFTYIEFYIPARSDSDYVRYLTENKGNIL